MTAAHTSGRFVDCSAGSAPFTWVVGCETGCYGFRDEVQALMFLHSVKRDGDARTAITKARGAQ